MSVYSKNVHAHIARFLRTHEFLLQRSNKNKDGIPSIQQVPKRYEISMHSLKKSFDSSYKTKRVHFALTYRNHTCTKRRPYNVCMLQQKGRYQEIITEYILYVYIALNMRIYTTIIMTLVSLAKN